MSHELMHHLLPAALVGLLGCFLAGCATYVPPSGRADLSSIASYSIRESFSAAPAAEFPASIALARVQAPAYRNYTVAHKGGVHGTGRYSVVTIKELGETEALQRLTGLPEVRGFVTLNSLLLPERLETELELREAAARLRADMLLMYTFQTSFRENDQSIALKAITLGLSPTRKVTARCTASALLLDTRTGFIYAALEANESKEVRTNAWESEESADRARQETEARAFEELVSQFEQNWPTILTRAKERM